MSKRPLSVTIIGWIYVAAGVLSLGYHATEFKTARPFEVDAVWACLSGLLAIVGGAFMQRGWNWARWLSILWMAGHVVRSAFHPLAELIMHAVLLATFAFFLFRPPAAAYFRSGRPGLAETKN